jgi:uridine kinase
MSDDKIKGSIAALTDVFATIDKALSEHEHIILAIDGNSGSGKSCLADLLAARYDCNVIHMDDFFLQPHQRTSERLKEPGGNIDYERFFGQVMSRLKTREEFQYQRYDCGKQELVGWITLTPKKLNIIEGVYSMHPLWNKLLDIRIFLTLPPQIQEERIRQRSGEEMLKRFLQEWIPMENRYFETFGIAKLCDLIIDTGSQS